LVVDYPLLLEVLDLGFVSIGSKTPLFSFCSPFARKLHN
jgi:hypothetical protein